MKAIGVVLLVIAVFSFLAFTVCAVVWSYQFDKQCGDYLKLAGDTIDIQKADTFLGQALDYIDNNSLTTGNSALIFHKPTADLKIWSEQIRGAKKLTAATLMRMQKDPNAVSELERTNILIKIRELVLDQGQQGASVTLPPHISWYPSQWLIQLWWMFSLIIGIIGAILIAVDFDY